LSTIKLVKANILGNEEVAPGHFVLKVESPEIAPLVQPGQFVHIKCGDEKGINLRRPFSFYKVKGKNLFILYQVLGKGTDILKMRSPGENISLLGPLGRGFWFRDSRAEAKKKVIIAGGVGIAPFPHLISEMIYKAKINPKDIALIYGAKRKEFLIGVDEFQKTGISLYLATDDGSEGFKGTTAELLLKLYKEVRLKGSDYFVCGPEVMMKSIVEITKKWGERIQVSLEERMGCGLGACLSCVKKINGRYLRICTDGPVFWGDEVEWRT